MKQTNLEQRRQALCGTADEEDDFEEIVASSRSPASVDTKIVMLPLACLVEYTDERFETLTGRPQPFKTYSQERLESLAKSIQENGVITPIVVKPLNDGIYQILAGRNRTRASRLCGKATIPAIIRSDVDDVDAAMIMLDTNLEQRPNLCYSEKAYAYRMRVDLQRHQGRRTDIAGGEKQDVLSQVGKENNDSRRTVAYLIRLTYLIPSLLELVDNGIIGFKCGVALSYLSTDTQTKLFHLVATGQKVRLAQVKKLQALEDCGAVTEESLQAVFVKTLSQPRPTITISSDILQEYTDILPDQQETERLFVEFLKAYRCSVQQS